ncbi:MAG TPA: NAD(P)H-hydrate dehydratase [Candidatus Obscuribacterales bacterium]
MPEASIVTPELLRTMPLPDYAADADKSVYGKLLIVAGSRNCPGAALLAARAALRSGCGSVRVAAPASVAVMMGIAVPELYVIPLPETQEGTLAAAALAGLEAQFRVCRALLLGPGLGEHAETRDLCRELIAGAPLPMLIDAQGLAGLEPLLGSRFPAARLISPHGGEMARLCGGSPADTDAERVAADFAKGYGIVTVLKGQRTLIAEPAGRLFCNLAGTRGLGTAGSGDVLAGVIASLLTQRMDPVAAACWGVYLHALAGEEVARELGDDGLMAHDLLERLPLIQRRLRQNMNGA